MKIPIVGTPQAPNTQAAFAPVPIHTFDQVGEAQARLGQTVAAVASDLPVRIKTAIDQGTLAKAETNAHAHLADFKDSLNDAQNPQNGDPTSYTKRWQDAQTQFSQKIAEDPAVKGLSMAARRQFNDDMTRFNVSATQEVNHLATMKNLSIAEGSVRTKYEMEIARAGNVQTQEDVEKIKQDATTTIQKGIQTGIIHPEEGAQMIYQIPMKVEFNQALAMMSMDYKQGGGPIVLEKALNEKSEDGSFKNYPHIVGAQRQTIMFDASRNARILQAQVAEKYAVNSASGQQNDPNELIQDLKAGAISTATYKSLSKPQRTLDEPIYAGLVTAISKYDPKSDPDHTKEAAIWKQINDAHAETSPIATQRINELFKRKLDDRDPINSEVAKEGNKIIDENFRLGVYGKFETRVLNSDGYTYSTQTNPKVLAAAQTARARAQTQLNDWLSHPENERATPEQMQQFLSGVNKPQRKAALWAPVINPQTGATHK